MLAAAGPVDMAVAEGAEHVHGMMWQTIETLTELTGAQVSQELGFLNDVKRHESTCHQY